MVWRWWRRGGSWRQRGWGCEELPLGFMRRPPPLSIRWWLLRRVPLLRKTPWRRLSGRWLRLRGGGVDEGEEAESDGDVVGEQGDGGADSLSLGIRDSEADSKEAGAGGDSSTV